MATRRRAIKSVLENSDPASFPPEPSGVAFVELSWLSLASRRALNILRQAWSRIARQRMGACSGVGSVINGGVNGRFSGVVNCVVIGWFSGEVKVRNY